MSAKTKFTKTSAPFKGTIIVEEVDGEVVFNSSIQSGKEQLAQTRQFPDDENKWEYAISESADLFQFLMGSFYQVVQLKKEKAEYDAAKAAAEESSGGKGTKTVIEDDEHDAEEQAAAEKQAAALRLKKV